MDKEILIEPLGNIFKTTSGGTPSRKKPEFYLGNIPWVKSGELENNIIYGTEEKITEDAIKNSSAKIFPAGTLLIALYGATIGKLAFLGIKATTNQAVCGIFDNGVILSKYTYYFLLFRRQKLIQSGMGGAQPNISQDIVRKQPFPIIPRPKQRAIVSKIEQLFSDLDNGIDNFKKAQEQLRIYRQAVLKKAFEGNFTPKNDLQQFYKNVDDLPMDEKVRRDVPKFFKKCKLSGSFGKYYSIAEFLRKGILIDVKDGNHGGNHPKKSDFTEQGLPFVTANVVNNFKIDYSKAYKVNGMPLKKLKVGFAKTGDVILTHKGSVGRVAIANQEIVCTPQTTYYKVNENYLISKYLMYFFASTVFYNQLAEVKSQTTRDFVSISKQFNLFILLLPIKEQSQIVQEIETRLSICDKMEATIAESLKKAESLRQSILKKAFEGKLLSEKELEEASNAPDWEPAEKLLERIKAEKNND